MISITAFFLSFFAFAQEAPRTLTLDGRLYDSTSLTDPLLNNSVLLRVQILDNSKACVLYEETQTVDTSTSNGYFNIKVGSALADAKRTGADPGNAMDDIFQNRSLIAANNAGCVAGYTPAAGHERFLRMFVTPSGFGQDQLADMTINAVPTAMVAETVQGLDRSKILELGTIPDLTQANVEGVFSATNYPRMTALLGGTSTQYIRSTVNGAPIPQVAGNPGTLTVGYVWYDSVANVLKYYDGTVRTITQGGSGSFVVNGGQTGAVIAGTNDANTLTLKTNNVDRIVVGTTGNVGVATANPTSIFQVTTPSAGSANVTLDRSAADATSAQLQFRKSRGNSGAPTQVNSGDRLFSIVGTSRDNAGWSATDSVGIIANTTEAHTTIAQGTSISLETTPNGSVTRQSRMLIDQSGYVGVGTAAPTTQLHVNNSQNAATEVRVQNSNAGATAAARFSAQANGVSTSLTSYGTAAGNAAQLHTSAPTLSLESLNAAGTIRMYTGSPLTEKVTVLTNGNVGVGTATPGEILSLVRNQNAYTVFEVVNNDAGAAAATGMMAKSDAGNFGVGINSSGNSAGSAFLWNFANTPIMFATNNSEKMRLGANGALGIGTTTPTTGSRLDITGTTAADSSLIIPRSDTATRPVTGVNGMMRYNTSLNKFEAYENGGWTNMIGAGAVGADSLDFTEFKDAMALDASTDISVTGSNVLSITNSGTGDSFRVNDQAADTTPFVIDAAGKVGIGIAAPTANLEVQNPGSATIRTTNDATTNTSGLEVYLGTGGAGDSGGYVGWRGASSVPASATGMWLASMKNGESLIFGTNAGAANNTTERMRITSGGNVGIGTTAPTHGLTLGSGVAKATYNTFTDISNYERGFERWNANEYQIGVEALGTGTVRNMRIGTFHNAAATSNLYLTVSDGNGGGSSHIYMNANNLNVIDMTASWIWLNKPVILSGNTLNGAQTAGGNLTLDSTSAATKGNIVLAPSGGNVGIGTTSPNQLLTVEGPMSLRTQAAPAATANYGKIYVDSGDSDKLKYMNPAGAITDLSASGGTPAADSLDFTEFKEAMALDASTDIAVDNAEVLSITNTGTGHSLLVNDQAGDTSPFVITAAGDVGIGTSAPAHKIEVDNVSTTTAAGWNPGSVFGTSASPAANSASQYIGLQAGADNNNNFDVAQMIGVLGIAGKNGNGNVTDLIGVQAYPFMYAGTANVMASLVAQSSQSGGTVTDTVGVLVLPNAISGGTATNSIGVEIQARNGTNTWGLFQTGASDKNYFAGRVGMGSSTLTDGARLDITGTTTADSSVIIPRANTAARPTVGVNGMMRYNTSLDKFEVYEAGAWVNAVGSGAAGADSLDFTEFKDAMALDDSTDIAVDNAEVLSVTNTGTGDSFRVNDQAGDTSPFVVDASGNVGIGIAAPTDILHVQKDQAAATGMKLINASTTAGSSSGIYMQAGTDKTIEIGVMGPNTNYSVLQPAEGYISSQRTTFWSNAASGYMRWVMDSTEAMRLDSSGRLGIGTSSPNSRLSLVDAGGGQITLLELNNAQGVATNVGTNIDLQASNTLQGRLTTLWEGASTANSSMVFQTRAAGAVTEKMRLTSGGNLEVVGDASVRTLTSEYVNTNNYTDNLTLSNGAAHSAGTGASLWFSGNGTNGVQLAGAFEGANNDHAYFMIATRRSDSTTEKVRVNSLGQMGIGTASPNQLLTVEGPMSLRTQAAPTATANYGKLYVDSGDSDKLKYMNPAGTITDLTAAGGSPAADSLDFTHFADSMTLDASTTITASGTNTLTLTNTGTGHTFRVNDQAADTTPFIITDVGAVGVAVASPGATLHVADNYGAFRVSDEANTSYIQANMNNSSLDMNNGSGWFAINRSVNADISIVGGGGGLSVGNGDVFPGGRFSVGDAVDSDAVVMLANFYRKRDDATAPGAGMGGSIALMAEGNTNNSQTTVASIEYGWETAQTNDTTARDGYLSFSTTLDNSNIERMRIKSTGQINLAPVALPTGAAGDIVIDSGANNSLKWHNGTSWQTVGAGVPAADSLDFTEFKDALALDASTDIAVDNAEVLSITNTGTGASFRVNDQAGDTTPFLVAADGKIGIGTSAPSYELSFDGSAVRTVGMEANSAGNAGNEFYVRAGSSGAGTDLNGGDLNLYGGASTGSGSSKVWINVAAGLQGAGSTVRQPDLTLAKFDGAYRSVAIGGGSYNATGVSSFIIGLDATQTYSIAQNNSMGIMGGPVGIGTVTPAVSLDVGSRTDAIRVTNGTTAQRPTPAKGMIRYNTSTDKFEVYQGSAWIDMIGTATVGADSLNFSDLADSMTLDASTAINVTGTNELSITNTGTGLSLVVNDEAADASPFVISNAGDVGIGTNAPLLPLDVRGAGPFQMAVSGTRAGIGLVSSDNNLDAGIYFEIGGHNITAGLGGGGSAHTNAFFIDAGNDTIPIVLANGAAARFAVDSSGNVGLGGTITAAGNVSGAGLIANSAGNVGIGTATAGSKLEVNGRFVSGVGTDADALSALTVDFSAANMIRATAASAACGTLNFTNVAAGGSYTVTIPNATATCTTIHLNGATTNVKLPSGYGAGGVAAAGVVYTAIYDGTTLWVSYVPF